jgi:hypothetical protein
MSYVFPFRRLCLAAGAVLLALTLAATAGAVDLTLTRKSTEADKVRICVGLDAQGVDVAGTQNDLRFDPTCAALDKADCVVSEHHGKTLHGSIPASDPTSFRSLVFALDNVDPMSEGEVYCCDFTIKNEGDGCCAVTMGRLGISDPQGVALDVRAVPERICLIGDSPPTAAAAEPPAAAPAAKSAPSWLWIAIVAVAVVGVLFFALRRAG